MRHFRCFLVLGVVSFAGGVLGNATITTATPVVPSSARPTTLMRLIQVRREDFHQENTTDIFKNNLPPFRSRRSMRVYNKIWIWDYWCLLQPRTGNCGHNVTKYYYNIQLDHCMTFTYTGCTSSTKSNNNRFDSVSDCEQRCKGASIMPASNSEANACELQPNSGRCLGSNEMYYYDVNEAKCKVFVYGGCGGNANKFGTLNECLAFCGNIGRKQSSDSIEYSAVADDSTSVESVI